MSGRRSGRPLWAALFICCAAPTAKAEDVLRVTGPAGAALIEENVSDGTTWCLRWNHSVTGGKVADCFADRDGKMMLERSYLHDFSAGLGEVQGRGRLTSAPGGGYWIVDMNELIPHNRLTLRVGHPAVDHRLDVNGKEFSLSRMAPDERVTLRLTPNNEELK